MAGRYLLLLLVVLALVLRLFGGLSTMLFTYDQARDAFFATSIWNGNWKIVGPPTDLAGVFHGPLYYYFLAPLYGVFGGDPKMALLGMILTNILTLVPLWFLAHGVFQSRRTAFIALFLFTVSYEAVSYARWLSNPALAVLPMAIFYLGLWQIIRQKPVGFAVCALGLGGAVQAQLFLLYLGVVVVVGLLLFRPKISLGKPLALGLLVLAMGLSTFFIAEVKFHWQGVKGLTHFLVAQNKTEFKWQEKLENFTQRENELFVRNLLPTIPSAAGVLGLAIITGNLYLAKRKKLQHQGVLFCLFLLVSPVVVFLASRMDLTFITVGVGLVVILLTANFISELFKRSWVLAGGILLLVAASNITHIAKINAQGNIMFQVQEGMRLSDELAVVQKTYEISKASKMTIRAVTNPLFYPTLWAYLYQWQTQKTKATIPFYHGTTTYSFQGDWVFPRSDDKRTTDLTIVEPQPGIPEDWKVKILAEENLRGQTEKTVEVGKFLILVRSAPAL